MKTYAKNTFLIVVMMMLIPGLMAQEQTLKYNVRVLGMDVGVLTVTEKVEDGDTIIEALTDVKVRIVFAYKVKYVQKCIYRDGELLNSSLLTYKKDRLNSSTSLTRKGNGYDLVVDDESSFLHNRIKYSGSLLYFHEPLGVKELCYEISGEVKPIAAIGAHTYQVIDPVNGRESIFEYENGKLKRSSVEQGIATIHTERLYD